MKMNLKDECITYANKRREGAQKARDKADAEFCEKAIERLHEVLSFGEYCYYDVPGYKDQTPIIVNHEGLGQFVFNADGINFRVRRSKGYMDVIVFQHCFICDKDWESAPCGCRADIGQVLLSVHPKYDCKKTDEIKEQTIAERLEELIREIIRVEIS